MYRFPISRFVISVLAVCLLPLATQVQGKDKGEFKLTPDRKLLMAEQVIERFYVDSVDAGNMVQDAIVAMLKTLDPHSSYSDPEEPLLIFSLFYYLFLL